MSRPPLEVADIFCAQGAEYRRAHQGRLSLGQLKVMSAIERCRTRALGGHKLHCHQCGTDTLAYNSCRNRHCPKCQASAAERWLQARQADLLPIPYFHVVFTLPEALRAIAYQNKETFYDRMFKIAAETLLTIAADDQHLGATIGITAVLHTWGSSLVHHPHIHCIVTGGGLRPVDTLTEQYQWIASRPNFFLPVKVLGARFRNRFLQALRAAHQHGELKFFGEQTRLADLGWFTEHLKPLRKIDWIVYAKRPFAGPEAVLTYLSRYTHRVAISNRRLVAFDERGVTFRYKDYRDEGKTRWKSMTLPTEEFIRRFLQHVLPKGFHRIRHYGLFTNASRRHHLTRARALLHAPPIKPKTDNSEAIANEGGQENPRAFTCRQCGAPMVVIEILLPQHAPRAPPQRHAA
jgi:Putative transposase/Transposase zinc-binding domain